jgi:hypothetical protein
VFQWGSRWEQLHPEAYLLLSYQMESPEEECGDQMHQQRDQQADVQ